MYYFTLIILLYFLTCFVLKKRELKQFNNTKLVVKASKQNPIIIQKAFNKAKKNYPNLKKELIIIKELESNLPYFARPTLTSIIFPFFKRVYLIGISTSSTKIREPTLIHNLSFKAKVGVFSHELAHIYDYNDKSMLKIIIIGICYLRNDYKEKIEKKTDKIAIQHNLFEYIYQWSKEVYPIKKRDGKRGKIYYSPNQLKNIIKNKKND